MKLLKSTLYAASLVGFIAGSSASANDSPDIKELKDLCWEDGIVFYGNPTLSADGKSLDYTGGTPHEGGYTAKISKINKETFLFNNDVHDNKVISFTREDDGAISGFSIKGKNNQTIAYYKASPKCGNAGDSLSDSANLARALEGTYKSEDGIYFVTFTANPDGTVKVKDSEHDGSYSFKRNYDFVVPIIDYKDDTVVEYEITQSGITVYPADFKEDEYWDRGDDKPIAILYAEDSASPRFAYTAKMYLTDGMLSHMPLPVLRIVRNEIFARHGKAFKSTDLKNYFASKAWYKEAADQSHVEDGLNEYERANITILLFQEEQRKKL